MFIFSFTNSDLMGCILVRNNNVTMDVEAQRQLILASQLGNLAQVHLTHEHVRLAQEKSPASLGKRDQKESRDRSPSSWGKIYAFGGRNRFDGEIIRGGLHSRGIFPVFPVLTSWSWT